MWACDAIRWSFVDTVGDLNVSPVGPFNKTLCPASPSLQWVLWASVPHLPGQDINTLDHRYYDPLRLPNAHLGVVRSSLSYPNTLDRPSLPLCLPHFCSNAGLVEGRDIPPQRRDFAIHGWISFYHPLTQGSIWTSQVPKLPPWMHALVSDPGGVPGTSPLRTQTAAFRRMQSVGFPLPLHREIILLTTTKSISGLNTQPASLIHPASYSHYWVCTWTSLLTCWLLWSGGTW
jgi:hypothetical protein